jgi:CRP/FNR family cyclic AMP-dependent transcriptional regulator
MVKTDEMITFLAKIPLFQGLNNRQLKQLANRFVPRTYQPGQVIVAQGKGGEGMFTILSGHAEALLEMADGSKTVVNEFVPTDFFGEVAMLDDGPRTASVVATQATECLVLSRSDFIAMMQNDAEMATEIAVALAKRLRRAVGAL